MALDDEVAGLLRRVMRPVACGALLLIAACSGSPPEGLILISIDTLRADRLAAYGGELGLTPHLDALANKSLVVRNAFAPAPFTLPSVGAMLTGRYPDELGIQNNTAVLPDQIPTLASWLGQHGWRTAAVVSNFVLRKKTRLDRGFDYYDAAMRSRERVRGLPERGADGTTTSALRLLDLVSGRGSGPIFLWVHYQDPHGPYTAPAEWDAPAGPPPRGVEDRTLPVSTDDQGSGALPRYQALGDRRDTASYRAAYHAEIRFVDEQVGRLLDGIDRRGLLEDSVVIFTADHGESLGESDRWFAHGEALTASETAVPMFLRIPDGEVGELPRLGSPLDVFPTALAALGIEPPPHFSGEDLLDGTEREAPRTLWLSNLSVGSVRRQALLSDGIRYIVTRRSLGEVEELTWYGGEQDQGRDISPERRASLRSTFRELRTRLAAPRPGKQQDLTREECQNLRALGYLIEPSCDRLPATH
ncbi:MAG: sulfatase [bacterium]|nr:sulfatase [bacterium]MCP5069814.1 sulfatase [bacterium]